MTPRAAQAAATAQAPTCETKNEALAKSNEDTLIAAYRLRAAGFSEQAAVLVLDSIAQRGVRRVGRFVRRMPATKLRATLRDFESAAARQAIRPRGDLIQLRNDPRWPWRVSTS